MSAAVSQYPLIVNLLNTILACKGHTRVASFRPLHKQGTELVDHRQRRQIVVLGASNVEFIFRLAQWQMRALLSLADEPGPVK
jgi:hypothetical protein